MLFNLGRGSQTVLEYVFACLSCVKEFITNYRTFRVGKSKKFLRILCCHQRMYLIAYIFSDAKAAGGSLAEVVVRMEREKEKERRDRAREEKVRAQSEKNEDRLKSSLLRSQAPVMSSC